MTVNWSQSQVIVRRHRNDGCLRESWRFTINGGVLTLRGYTRETLPTRRHRKWQLVDVWGAPRRGEDTLAPAQVPLTNALAAEILTNVALTMEIEHNGLSLPSLGYRLTGVDTTDGVSDDAVPST